MNASLRIIFSAINLFFLGCIALHANAEAKRVHPSLEIYDYEQADKCDSSKLQVRITVFNVTPVGILTLELYNDPNNFLDKQGRVRRVRVPAGQSPQTVCMNINHTGRYAVAGYHDIDANRKLKKSMIKVPKEPFALSNNPKFKALKFPRFSDSAFYVGPEGKNITLELIDIKKQKKLAKLAEKAEKAQKPAK